MLYNLPFSNTLDVTQICKEARKNKAKRKKGNILEESKINRVKEAKENG